MIPRPWLDPEEAEQIVALARLEAEAAGFDPEAAADEAREEYKRSVWGRFRREKTRSSLDWVAEASRPVRTRPARKLTRGQRKKFLRDQVILAATIAGFSRRQLAEVFDLPHSRISAIVKAMGR